MQEHYRLRLKWLFDRFLFPFFQRNNLGLCEADKPCDCTQEYCTLPWWLETRDDKLNCRSDEVSNNELNLSKHHIQDCEETIAGCAGKKCFCANIEAVTDWEERGTCLSKDSRLD